MRHRWITAPAVVALLIVSAPSAWPLDMATVNDASLAPAASTKSKDFDPALIKAQVLLDRAGFSPGEIDGRQGENERKAIAAFEAAHGLKADGKLDAQVGAELANTSREPVLTDYTIVEKDVRGPFLKRLPAKMEEMKDLDWLGYTSPLEALRRNST